MHILDNNRKMKDNPKQIRKLVINPDEIEDDNSWRMSLNDILHSCQFCNSNLCYIKMNWGIVAEDSEYGVMGNKSNRIYRLIEVGLVIYCAECGEGYEHFGKWFYPEDKLVMIFDEIGDAEKIEVEYCLNQFDQKGDFKPQYNCTELNGLKEKLIEYEKKYPVKESENSKGGKTIK